MLALRGGVRIAVLVLAVAPALHFPVRAQAPASAGESAEGRLVFEVPETQEGRWWRGNTHTHTAESDGDSPPEVVAAWYRDHGYQFLVLSDHNVFTDPATLAHLQDSTFLLIPGEEVTSGFEGRPVHVNGLNLPGLVEPRVDATLLATVQANVDAVRAVDGVPHINHPNYGWALSWQVLERVRNDRLLEIFNGHPDVHNLGSLDAPGMEAVWDTLLTRGKRIYGIAVDDAHHFQDFSHTRANPGRGWVAVRAATLEAEAIMAALEAGHFYASTGVELDDVVVSSSRLEVRIRVRGSHRYVTEFIGPGGRVLARTAGNPAVFELPDGSDGPAYVRARVTDSEGWMAWVQPVFTRASSPSGPGR